MEMSGALHALRRGWLIILIGMLAGGGAAAALHRTQEPTYTAQGTYLVIPASTDPNIIQNINSLDSTRSRTVLTTLTEIMQSETVFAEATTATGLTGESLVKIDVVAAVLPEANGVTLSVTTPDRNTSVSLVSAVAAASGVRFVEFYRIYEIAVLDPPTLPTSPSGPGLYQLIAIAVAIGGAVGGAIALMRNPHPARRRAGVSGRIDGYGKNVTPLRDRDRFKRVG